MQIKKVLVLFWCVDFSDHDFDCDEVIDQPLKMNIVCPDNGGML